MKKINYNIVEQGDWLIPYKCDEPHQVKKVSYQEEPAGKWTVITFSGEGFWGTWYYPTSCTPIPITEDFLLLNGFTQNGISQDATNESDRTYDTYVWSQGSCENDDKVKVCLNIDHHQKNCIVEIFTPDMHVSGLMIQYVNELQHCLRLCRINKDIVI